jgi:hypothetical protein
MVTKTLEKGVPYDSDEFTQRPSCLDSAYEREAILSGLMGRGVAVFPENRPEVGYRGIPKKMGRDLPGE